MVVNVAGCGRIAGAVAIERLRQLVERLDGEEQEAAVGYMHALADVFDDDEWDAQVEARGV